MRDQDLTSGAKKIAKALKSPGGPIAFARVVASHLAWFDLAQERGLAWDQMIAVLHAAGATRPDGQPLTRGHVSSAVWRARKSAASNPDSSIKKTQKKKRKCSWGDWGRTSKSLKIGAPGSIEEGHRFQGVIWQESG